MISEGAPSARAVRRSAQRGTTLIEALVAFLALSFGVLALGRIQGQLRLAADTARYRSEAVRLAQADLEHLRSFASIDASGGTRSYADVVPETRRIGGAMASSGSPTYTLERRVDATSVASARSIRVEVRWTDRAGAVQSVTLASIIGANDPALGGALGLAPGGSP